MSKQISKSKRMRIYQRDNFTCQICGSITDENAHLDHLVHKHKQGTNNENNLATTCRSCNLKRGKRKSEDYLKIGCLKHMEYLRKLIKYEKKYHIFDEDFFNKKLIEYRKDIEQEIKNYKEIIQLLEDNEHES